MKRFYIVSEHPADSALVVGPMSAARTVRLAPDVHARNSGADAPARTRITNTPPEHPLLRIIPPPRGRSR